MRERFFVIGLSAAVVTAIAGGIAWVGHDKPRLSVTEVKRPVACATRSFRVEGASLAPAIDNGDVIDFQVGPDCPVGRLVDRGALVLINTARAPKPIAKFVYGMPGDRFSVQPTGGDMFNVVVNGGILENSAGRPFVMTRQAAPVLGMYAKSTGGVIPPDTYLVMGDRREGSLDSRQFGLVNVADIFGLRKGIRDMRAQ